MRGTKHWQHQANKNRDQESDVPDKFKVLKWVREIFGQRCLTDEVIPIPAGGFADYRKPDLLIKTTTPRFIIELQGIGPHGFEEDDNKPERDVRKEHDYDLLGKFYKVIWVYFAETNGYEAKLVIEKLLTEGLPIDKIEVEKYAKLQKLIESRRK